MICQHCEEDILPGEESNAIQGSNLHCECALRSIIGSVAHIERRCGCYVKGSTEHDPPGLTLRQSARAAVVAWNKKAIKDAMHLQRN